MRQLVVLMLFAAQSLMAQNANFPAAEKLVVLIDSLVYHHRSPIKMPGNKGLVFSHFAASYNSNTVPATFSNAFIFPKYIDEALKNTAIELLKAKNNRFGTELSYGFEATIYPDSIWKADKQAISLGYKSNFAGSGRFNADLFQLIFNGNSQFLGKNADLSETALYLINYRSLNASFNKMHNRFGYSVGMAVYQGMSHLNIDLPTAGLYTDTAAAFLDLNWKGSYLRSGAASNTWNASPSLGFGLNMASVLHLRGKYQISAEVQDLGFIQWNAQTELFKRDTAFRFTGLQFNDVWTYSDTNLVLGDSLVRRLRGRDERGSEMTMLPYTLRLGFSYSNGKASKMNLRFDLMYRNLPGMKPLATVEWSRQISRKTPNLRIIAGLNYGGFGGLRSHTAISYWAKHHVLKLGTVYNEGFIMPSRFSGGGVMLQYGLVL